MRGVSDVALRKTTAQPKGKLQFCVEQRSHVSPDEHAAVQDGWHWDRNKLGKHDNEHRGVHQNRVRDHCVKRAARSQGRLPWVPCRDNVTNVSKDARTHVQRHESARPYCRYAAWAEKEQSHHVSKQMVPAFLGESRRYQGVWFVGHQRTGDGKILLHYLIELP